MRRLRLICRHWGPFWSYAATTRANWGFVAAMTVNLPLLLGITLERDPGWIWLLLALAQMTFFAIGVGLAAGSYRRSLGHARVYTRNDIKGRWW